MKFADNKDRSKIYTFVKRVEDDRFLEYDLNADIKIERISYDESYGN